MYIRSTHIPGSDLPVIMSLPFHASITAQFGKKLHSWKIQVLVCIHIYIYTTMIYLVLFSVYINIYI